MAEDTRSEHLELARELNEVARSVLEEDGEHAAMFFLLVEDGIEAHQFSDEQRPVGEARGREVAAGPDAVVCVGEAWGAALDEIPEGGGAGDAPGARDVLLVTALDRDRNEMALRRRSRAGRTGGSSSAPPRSSRTTASTSSRR